MTKKRWIILIAGLVSVAIILIISIAIGNMFTCHTGKPQSQLEGPVKQEWVAHYHCDVADTLESAQAIQAIAIDKHSDTCVTGTGYCSSTIKYNSAGKELWVAQSSSASGASMAIDTEGNVYVIGLRGEFPEFPKELSVVKYNADGKELWVSRRVSDTSYIYSGESIALDKQGNAYVTINLGNYSKRTVYTLKYSGFDGTELWMASHELPSGPQELPSMVIDDSGNIYVVGINDLIKYDSDGRELWSISLGEGNAWYAMLALDPQGNVCVATWKDRIAKYYSNGSQIWTASYNSTQGDGQPCDIAVDKLGSIYVLSSLATVKYGADGTPLWIGTGGEAIALDDIGNVYITGTQDNWCVTTKYDANGTEVWTARYWGGFDSVSCRIALDASGNVYISGTSIYKICPRAWWQVDSAPNADYSEYITIKYSQQ